ncbi:DUF2505 domain-containing protein [Nocardia huaxiensis]|uniref:DUF2505 domain-containing protein n=1 Tax=Nocardia huaxiensis TaxID=2755382 RepID=A0A7D6ZFB5_9NOCA|nr:DUF2505 domain-containing protein [Nocardia huaxiensis]QLY32238.1 DUF2505 domain-containing protein [Nocardia huaxiensis]UFS94057.1 DUF2505 domain-containing protein [Nocardia huaxiensis]
MPRRLDYSARYPLHTTKEVYAALMNRDHWDARIEEMRKYSPNDILSLDAGDSGIRVVLRHVLPRDTLPEMAQAVMHKDMVITRREVYSPFGPEVTGEYTAEIPGGPGTLGGTMRLFPTETGCTLRTSSQAEVRIPFFGRKLEQVMLVNLIDLFRAEAEVTKTWLDQQNPVG